MRFNDKNSDEGERFRLENLIQVIPVRELFSQLQKSYGYSFFLACLAMTVLLFALM